MTQPPDVDGIPAMNWRQEMRLYFTRRAEGLPEQPGDQGMRRVLDGESSPWPEFDRLVRNEYRAWQIDCGIWPE